MEENKIEICEQCKNCVYEVLPNFKVCTSLENMPITIVVETMKCPLEKW